MTELRSEEKIKMVYATFDSFLEGFKPLDKHSMLLLDYLFEKLMTRRIRDEFQQGVSLSSEEE